MTPVGGKRFRPAKRSRPEMGVRLAGKAACRTATEHTSAVRDTESAAITFTEPEGTVCFECLLGVCPGFGSTVRPRQANAIPDLMAV